MEETNRKKSNKLGYILGIIIICVACGLIARGIQLMVKEENTINTTEEVVDSVQKIDKNISEEEALAIGNELWQFAFDLYWDGKCELSREEIRSKFAENAIFLAPEPVSIMGYDKFTHANQENCQGEGREKLHHYKKTTLEYTMALDYELDFVAYTELCAEDICTEDSETVETIDGNFYISKTKDGWIITQYYLPILPE